MAPLWSLSPALDSRRGIRLLPRNTQRPLSYEFQLYKGHIDHEAQLAANKSISSTAIQRHFIHPDVERVDVRDGRLRGTMFIPKGDYFMSPVKAL